MRDKHYKVRCIRINDETWNLLQNERKISGDSWNLFLLKAVLKKDKPYAKKARNN